MNLLFWLLIQIFILAFPFIGLAQLDPTFSGFQENTFFYNPAAAGDKNIQANVLSRNRGSAFITDYSAHLLSVHAPLLYKSVGIGGIVLYEKQNIFKHFSVSASYSYKINFFEGHLSLGISSTFHSFQADESLIEPLDENDILYQEISSVKNNFLNFGTGLMYKNNNTIAGLSFQHLGSSTSRSGFNNLLLPTFPVHLYGLIIHKIRFKKGLSLSPILLYRKAFGLPSQIEAGMIVGLNKLIETGLTFRTSQVASFQILFQISEILKGISNNVRIGYSYEQGLTQKSINYSQFHQLNLSYNFDIVPNENRISKKRRIVSPAFF